MPVSFVIVQPPQNGTLTRVGLTDRYQYAPNAGFVGGDTFSYKAVDGGRESNVALVKIQVANHPLMEFTIFEPTEQVVTGDHLLFCPVSTKRLLEAEAEVSAIVNGAPGTYGVEQESRINVELIKVNADEDESSLMLQPKLFSGGNVKQGLTLASSVLVLTECVHVRVVTKVGDVRGLKVRFRAQQL